MNRHTFIFEVSTPEGLSKKKRKEKGFLTSSVYKSRA